MIMAAHPFARRTLNALDGNGSEGCAYCGRPRSVHPAAPAVTASSPGQAAYEARLTARRTRLLCAGESAGTERPWPHLTAAERADEEAAAQAAIAAAPVDLTDLADWTELLREGNELRSQLASVTAERDQAREQLAAVREFAESWTEPDGVGELLAQIVALAGGAQPSASQRRRLDVQAAPELAAAMAETRKVADAANVVFDLFGRSSDGWHARISGVNLMRAYKAIGRRVPGHLSHLEGQ